MENQGTKGRKQINKEKVSDGIRVEPLCGRLAGSGGDVNYGRQRQPNVVGGSTRHSQTHSAEV